MGEAVRESISDTMEKPLLDDRSYRVIQLPNQLEILLIHDPATDKAAAAMDVNVGSFSDPDDLPGTAHAVEHLCFMGTKKYPEETEYSTYLTKYGGYSNAFTASTSTNYFFELSASSTSNNPGSSTNVGPISKDKAPLYGALDRFAQFFIQPLFLADTLRRELRAVDSENKKHLQNDTWRLEQMGRSTSSEKHPIHKFATGNYQCLREEPVSRGVDIRQRFIDFYDAHYSANRMKLVVLGRESLQELESWVQELFSEVPNKNLHRPRWDGIPVLGEPELMTQIFVKPVTEQRQLNIDFTYPDEEELFNSHPSQYLAHLLGHGGPGSALAYLKELGLADTLMAGASAQCPGSALFCIDVRLTEKGVWQYREVLKVIFQYIAMLKENSPPPAWIWDEMSRLAEVDFKFKQKSPPSQTVSGLAQIMQISCTPREHLLSSDCLIREFDPENIERGLSYLRPDNFRFFLVDQQFPGDWNAKEKWYETEYKLEKIPQDFMQDLWAAAQAPAPSRLHLPAVNEFVPQRLEVERKDITEPARHPTLIRHDDNVRVWFKKDDQFWVPKANIKLFLRSPMASLTPLNAVMTRLYVDLVEDSLNEYAYNADIAGLSYSLSENAQGLNIELSGFSDKMSVLLEKVLLGVRDLEIKQEPFEVAKERVRKAYKNFDYMDPYRQINAFSRILLVSERSWAPFEMLDELPAVTAQDIRSYFPELLRQMHIEILVHGNLYREDALNIAKLVESTLRPRRLPESQWPSSRRTIALPNGANYLYERILKNPDNFNHCLEYIISVGSVSDRLQRAKLLLFAQISHGPCFETLRSKEQLGYIVNSAAGVYVTAGTWRILVQSERDCKYLEQRCDAFLVSFEQDLHAMTDETFEEHKIGLINNCLEKLKNLGQETSRFWTHITSEEFDFEQVYRDVENIEPLTKKDMLEFFNQYIHPSSSTRAKLSIHLIARASAATAEDNVSAEENPDASAVRENQDVVQMPVKIENVKEWKASLHLSAAATSAKALAEFKEFGSKS